MRAGERIVQALTALPSAPIASSGTGGAGGAENRRDPRHGGSSKDRAIQRPPTQQLDAALTGAGSDLDGVIFSAPTLNFAIKELGERGDFERAHALYVWMGTQRVDPKYAPNSYTLVTLFGAAREKHHAKVIVKAWQRALRLKGDALYAFELSLSLEKLNNDRLIALHHVAAEADDANMQDFIEGELLEDQVKSCLLYTSPSPRD